MRFLADESRDFTVVVALHDVTAIVKFNRGADDEAVVAQARYESRILLTENKDFGLLVYAGGQQNAGVVLIRFPGDVRALLGEAVVSVIAQFGGRLSTAFVVIEPGRARLSKR